MPFTPTIRFNVDASKAKSAVKPKPKEIARVNRLVINKIVTMVHKDTGALLPRGAGVRVVGFRKIRTYKTLSKAKDKVQRGSVWLGGNRVAARFAGKPKNVKGGAKAGRHVFEGAFVARMENGYESVFRRSQKKTRTGKFKLIEETVPVPNLVPLAKRSLAKASSVAEPLLKSELEKVINRRKR